MNILDEIIPDSQRAALRKRHVVVRQVGEDIGRKGMKDDELIALLRELNRPTFFTLDNDFYDRRLRHKRYCLVYLDVVEDEIAEFVYRVLHHRHFNTRAKRMGCVIRVTPKGLMLRRLRQDGSRTWPGNDW